MFEPIFEIDCLRLRSRKYNKQVEGTDRYEREGDREREVRRIRKVVVDTRGKSLLFTTKICQPLKAVDALQRVENRRTSTSSRLEILSPGRDRDLSIKLITEFVNSWNNEKRLGR